MAGVAVSGRTEDTRLARHLQKRGVYPHYSKCLDVVRKVLVETDKTLKEIIEMIDRGELDNR